MNTDCLDFILSDVEDQVTVQDVKFVKSCGEKYNPPTTQPPKKP